MNNILEQLFNGEIYPDKQIVPTDPEYYRIHKTISKNQDYLKQKLSLEDGERIDRLDELYTESSSLICYYGFSHGFKLAAQLMCESFTENIKAIGDRD